MRKIIKYIFIIIFTFIAAINYVLAMEWKNSGNKITYGGKSLDLADISKWRAEEDFDKEIESICFYEQVGNDSSTTSNLALETYAAIDKLKFLFIYTDGTASISWDTATWCERNAKAGVSSNAYICTDGYRLKDRAVQRGLRNWSKNKNGVLDSLKTNQDAYNSYQKNGKDCPYYLAQSVDGRSNYFYLSYSNKATNISTIRNLAEKEKGNQVYEYYNILESSNISNPLSCDYSDDEDSTSPLITIDFGTNGSTMIQDGYYGRNYYNKNGELQSLRKVYLNSRIHSSSYLKLIKAGKCPKTLDSCTYWYYEGIGGHSELVVYGDASVSAQNNEFCKTGNDSLTLHCIGDNCSDESICQYYSEYKDELVDLLVKYNATNDKSKRASIIDDYNLAKDKLNSFCKSVLKTMDYEEGSCVESCIESNKELYKMEVENGFRTAKSKDKCYISDSILSMVYNILKWAKYVLPAIIIILTMLDFIKAIAAQNDDDMKKAQGRFIKRLIIAALLFLLPLIINFILQTFGMYNSECDLF